MKRSEMLNKMVYCYESCTKGMNYSPEKAMDRVLEICEESGMLPPDCPHRDDYLNEWEPEDEKK